VAQHQDEGQKTIAVVFGGRSVEHDVSILSGLQLIEAMDPTRYQALPVYVAADGQWWTGDALLDRRNYPLDVAKLAATKQAPLAVSLDLGWAGAGRPRLLALEKGFFGLREKHISFDLVIPAIHGSNGEDGSLQGLLEFANIPYSGCRVLGAATTMDKVATKHIARDIGLKLLPEVLISRPQAGSFIDPADVEQRLISAFGQIQFPLIAKPVMLGSSVGVQRVANMDDLMGALLHIFKIDSRAMIEPCVEPLVEYNVAVRRAADGSVVTSAIERPKTEAELLDFATKYLSGGGKKVGGAKTANQSGSDAGGMVFQSRTLHPPELSPAQETQIREHAASIFERLDLGGSVRIDFLCNGDSGDIWMNEINTVPGSFAYFLWEAANKRISFLDLVSRMIDEGEALHARGQRQTDVHTGGAQIFGR